MEGASIAVLSDSSLPLNHYKTGVAPIKQDVIEYAVNTAVKAFRGAIEELLFI